MSQKEKIPGPLIGLIINRTILVADVVATPVLATLYDKIGFCYGGLGVLLASGWIDMYLTGQLKKHKNKASDSLTDSSLHIK